MKDIISTAEAAKILGLTKGRIRQLLQSGEIKGQRVGRTWIIYRRDIEEFQRLRKL